jgi:hypothetical protein
MNSPLHLHNYNNVAKPQSQITALLKRFATKFLLLEQQKLKRDWQCEQVKSESILFLPVLKRWKILQALNVKHLPELFLDAARAHAVR